MQSSLNTFLVSLNVFLIIMNFCSIYVLTYMEKKKSKKELRREIDKLDTKIKESNDTIQEYYKKNESLEKTFFEQYYDSIGNYIIDSAKYTGFVNSETSLWFILVIIFVLLAFLILILILMNNVITSMNRYLTTYEKYVPLIVGGVLSCIVYYLYYLYNPFTFLNSLYQNIRQTST